jgi:hypothetical protein
MIEPQPETLRASLGCLPLFVGVDPYHKRIDRNPGDNLARAEAL